MDHGRLSPGRAVDVRHRWRQDPGRRAGHLIDVVGGTPPTGALNPTIDMRVQTGRAVPSKGTLRLERRPLRTGRTNDRRTAGAGVRRGFDLRTVCLLRDGHVRHEPCACPACRASTARSSAGPTGSRPPASTPSSAPPETSAGVAELAFNPVVGNGFTGIDQRWCLAGACSPSSEPSGHWPSSATPPAHAASSTTPRHPPYLNRLARRARCRPCPSCGRPTTAVPCRASRFVDAAEPERVVSSSVQHRDRPARRLRTCRPRHGAALQHHDGAEDLAGLHAGERLLHAMRHD